MNAYELADELLRDNTQLTVKAAYMLRQQADRIAELKNAKQFIQNFAEEQHRRACALEESQTKPLSDEEIKIIATQNRTDLTIPAYISFARAIEERHGIK